MKLFFSSFSMEGCEQRAKHRGHFLGISLFLTINLVKLLCSLPSWNITTQTSVKTAQTNSRVHFPVCARQSSLTLSPHTCTPLRLRASVPADGLTAMRHISSGTPTMTVCPSREPWPLCQPGAISTAIRLLAQI